MDRLVNFFLIVPVIISIETSHPSVIINYFSCASFSPAPSGRYCSRWICKKGKGMNLFTAASTEKHTAEAGG